MTAEFVECDTCRRKPGSPPLCFGCLHNREVINDLNKQLHRASKFAPDDTFQGRFNGPHILTDRMGWTARCCGNPEGCKWCANEAAYRGGNNAK